LLELEVTQNIGNGRDVERYVSGTLSEDDAARFEEAMIAHPELAADVSVRRRIKAGLSELEKNKELETFLKPQVRPTYVRYAAAAAILVVIAAGLMTFWNREGAAPLHVLLTSTEVGSRPISTTFTLATTRSADEPVFEVQRAGGPVELQILVEDADAAPFTVHLAAQSSGARSIKDASVSQVASGFAFVWLEPRELDSGKYTLTLVSESGAEQHFPFQLRVVP
jgi:preprotein translocase subunit Sec61beta